MNQIILLTALTATSGLFGGGRHCAGGRCGYPAMRYAACAPMRGHGYGYGYGYGCQPGSACAPMRGYGYGCQPGGACAVQGAPAPVASYPAVGAPTASYPAAAPMVQAPQTAYYPTTYYPTAPACAGGTCYRR